jgi:lipoprotein-anchoring transpeptidase ErfK/SrfK
MPRALRCILLAVATAMLATVMVSAPSLAGDVVEFSDRARPGTIVVRTNERKLYFVVKNNRAIQYPVGVGRLDKQWFGATRVASKQLRPAWSPPAEIRRGRPNWVIPSDSPRNPMGAAALVLADNELAIHGTNNPGSVGGFVSWGCIRMHNKDIMDLYKRVDVGTRVVFAR